MNSILDNHKKENTEETNNGVFYVNTTDSDNISECKEPTSLKDILAIIWATITVLGPVLLGAGVIFFLVILFVLKVWWKV